jgi:hypothetical protein
VLIELWAVEAFVFRLLLLLVLCKQLLCVFIFLIFLCGMMPFFVVGVLPMLDMQAPRNRQQDATLKGINENVIKPATEVFHSSVSELTTAATRSKV